MNTQEILESATEHLVSLPGHVFDLLTISKPVSPKAAINLAKVISKLSPLLGNLIEFHTVEFLNDQDEYRALGEWKRQDPGFPDAVFVSSVSPVPGFEIKAWFPLATEITARFKDSQNHFAEDQTYICLLAWLPQRIIYGKPHILDVCVASGLSVAQARDDHYHNPPDYLVLEPENTSTRTRNLQQTNTNGYKWQGTPRQFSEAQEVVARWGNRACKYEPTAAYQLKLRELIAKYPYRLDTNFAKIDRIGHRAIEAFKARVLQTSYNGMTIQQWARLLSSGTDTAMQPTLETYLAIYKI